MTAPIRPTPRTGPAGAYDEACRLRVLRAVEWFGLDPAVLLRFDLGTLSFVAYNARPTPTRGEVGSWEVSADEDGYRYEAQIHLTSEAETDEFLAHIGPPPTPPATISVWDARAEDLTPGTKLYDAEGNQIGELGDRVPNPELWKMGSLSRGWAGVV